MQGISRWRAASAALVLAGGVAAFAAGTGTAWAATSMSGTPSTNLKDGSTIAITGTDFGANNSLFIVQCSSTTDASCDTARLSSAMSDASGNVSTTFTVHTGAIGNGTCAPGSSNCIVAMIDLSKQHVGFMKLSFAPATTPSPTKAPSPAPTKAPTPAPTRASGGHTSSRGSSRGSGSLGSGSTSGSGTPTRVAAGSGGGAGRENPDVGLAVGLGVVGTLLAAAAVGARRRFLQA